MSLKVALEAASDRGSHGGISHSEFSHEGCLRRMPIGKVPTEEFLMEGTHSGGSHGGVSSQQDCSKHHNHKYTCYSPRCKYHSPRHILSKEIECIADKMTRILPISSSRYRFFPPKRGIADRKHMPYPNAATTHENWPLRVCRG